MITLSMTKKMLTICLFSVIAINTMHSQNIGHTEVTKWQYGKNGAISITYDDGTINQFRVALPIMDRLNIPGTFFINTSALPGSKYKGKFIGRPVNEIINDSKTVPTNKENVYERASAARYLGYEEGEDYFTRAGASIDANRYENAYKILDEFYKKVANDELLPASTEGATSDNENILTWDMVYNYVDEGHEFASHMVTHPYVSALDEPNLLYELEKSHEEILERLGIRYTISAECPYGTNDDRAMQYATKIYPVLRNRIPEEYMLELHRPSRVSPVNDGYEYVQWQRGAISKSTIEEMKAWVDTTAMQKNIWLVLVVHGIDGIGWEALKGEDVDTYYSYIKSREDDVWVATFGDAGRYMKQRMNATVSTSEEKGIIKVSLDHSLDKALYDIPLTLKTFVNPEWKEAVITQGESFMIAKVQREGTAAFILYQAMPGEEIIEISEEK